MNGEGYLIGLLLSLGLIVWFLSTVGSTRVSNTARAQPRADRDGGGDGALQTSAEQEDTHRPDGRAAQGGSQRDIRNLEEKAP